MDFLKILSTRLREILMTRDWLNMFSEKSLKVLYNLTFVMRCAFYAAVVGLLVSISQELIAIRFSLDSLDKTMKRSVPKQLAPIENPATTGGSK